MHQTFPIALKHAVSNCTQRSTFVQIAVSKPQAAQAAEVTTPEAKMKTLTLIQLHSNGESWQSSTSEKNEEHCISCVSRNCECLD